MVRKSVEQEFLSAYDEYSDAIFRHCYFRIYDRELAKDLVQDTFFKTWTYIEKGEVIKNLRAFLYKVANNLIIDHSRTKKHSTLSLDKLAEKGFVPQDNDHHSIEKKIATKEVIEKLDQLDRTYRIPMIMRYIDELSVKEIARALNLSENVVSVRIHRGLDKLKKLVQSDE